MAFDIEQLFQSFDIILTQRLSDLSFDTTVIATIVDDSEKNIGHYIVSDGTIKFDAYTNDTSYKTDDQVRVTILNGDWTQKKFIEGKYTEGDGTSAIPYIPPLGTTMQNSQSNLGIIDDYTLYANYSPRKVIKRWAITQDSEYYTLQANGIFNVITLQADFQTNLGYIAQGNYGLLLELFIQPEPNSNQRIRKYVTFDSSEMIGNPYSFIIDSRQAKRITIASEGIVTEMALSIYQGQIFEKETDFELNTPNSNPFIYKDEEEPFVGVDGENPIHFKNVTLGFGTDLTTVEDNSLKIYTTSSATYQYNEGEGANLTKDFGLVWYNKTEDDQYIGFSDGVINVNNGIVQNYDEIEYNKLSFADARLLAQKAKSNVPTDELGLSLAANIAESETYYTQAYKALTTDLAQVLSSMGRQLGNSTLRNDVNTFIAGNDAILTQYGVRAEELAQDLVAYYSDILQYAADVQMGNEANWDNNWDNADYFNQFMSQFRDGALTDVEQFMEKMDAETQKGEVLSGYRGVYDAYLPKVKKVISAIDLLLSQIKHTVNNNEDIDLLKSYKSMTKDEFIPYAEQDLSPYNNRYCIYWYHYNKDYNPAVESDEYKYGHFLGNYWERITADASGSPVINLGLPREAGETIDDIAYFPASPNSTQILTYKLSPTTEFEQFQVVLFYNHEMVKSNVITFTNSEAELIPNEFKVSESDTLIIDHGPYSQDHYQSYTSAFDLVNIADEVRSRVLTVAYDGALVGDEALAGAGIYWYIPVDSTMLTFDKDYLRDTLGFVTDLDGETDKSKSGYKYFYKQITYTEDKVVITDEAGNPILDDNGLEVTEDVITITPADKQFVYKIKPFYEASAQNNTILVEVHVYNAEQEHIVLGEKSFTFSTFGNNGTKYTLSVVPATTQIAVLANPGENSGLDGDLELHVSLRNADGKLLTLSADTIKDTASEEEIVTYDFEASWYARSIVDNANTTISDPADTDQEKIKLIEIGNQTDRNGYVGILNTQVSFDTTGRTELENRKIVLNTLYSVPFSSSEDFYISGPTTIVYDNQGIVSRCSEDPFRLYSRYDDKVVENQVWTLLYYDNKGNLINTTTEAGKAVYDYMPILAQDNTIIPAPMYFKYSDDNSAFYVPVAQCKVNNEIAWTQPIIITQNKYASSTLNEWNGQFEINEENGTIMSTMLGAGKKTEKNTFEGVLIGDIEAGANFDTDNADGIGIYGFNDGAQSFYLGVDGRAFFGKSGRGRIYIDGNEGTISSASYQQNKTPIYDKETGKVIGYENHKQPIYGSNGNIVGYETYNTAGMMIDLDDGFIDMKGVATETDGSYKPKATPLTEEEWNKIKNTDTNIGVSVYPTYADYKEATKLLTEEEWNNLDSSDDRKSDYETYGDYYKDWTIYVKGYKQSGIHVDVKNPYFRIHSANQTEANRYLMFVGDNEYYLESDNFIKQPGFDLSEQGEIDFTGRGMKIDLMTGFIDAYNFKLISKNVLIDSTDDAETYFAIKDNSNQIMFYAGSRNNLDKFYLKSTDFVPMSGTSLGSGMKLTLAGGTPNGIEAYSFNLRAGNTGAGDHRIILQDVSPYLIVNTNGGTVDNPISKSLAVIGDNEFYFQSVDYVKETSNSEDVATAKGKGMRLSISGHEIEAYEGFTLRAYKKDNNTGNDTTNYILLDANASKYPLRITDNFKVSWAGSITAEGGEFNNINATGGTFNNISVTGNFTSGTISGSTIYASALYAGGANAGSSQSTDTQLIATTGGVTIKNATIQGGNSAAGGGAYYGFSSDGQINGRDAILDNLTVNTALTIPDEGNLIVTGKAIIGGTTVPVDYQMQIAGKTQITGDLELASDLYIGSGKYFYFGTKSSSTHMRFTGTTLEVYGNTIVLGRMGASGVTVKLHGEVIIDNKTSIDGSLTVESGNSVYFANGGSAIQIKDGDTYKSLKDYIQDNASGWNWNIGRDSDTAKTLVDSSGTAYSIGSASQPVYFSGGIPIAANNIPSIKTDYGSYGTSYTCAYVLYNSISNTDERLATKTWVDNNFCGVSGPTITRIKARLKALDGLDS